METPNREGRLRSLEGAFDAAFCDALRGHLEATEEPRPTRRRRRPEPALLAPEREIADEVRRFASAIDRGSFFVFRSHHADPGACLPLVVAILDSDLECTATLPARADRQGGLDAIFVCRKPLTRRTRQLALPLDPGEECRIAVGLDVRLMEQAGLRVGDADRRRLWAGHVARLTIRTLCPTWEASISLSERTDRASACLHEIARGSVEARAPAERRTA